MPFRTLRLNWIQECGDSRCPTQSQEHQPKMIREDKMRSGEQQAGQAATAQIRKHGFCALTESERRVLHVSALQEAARKQHERHQSNAVDRRPKMQFD